MSPSNEQVPNKFYGAISRTGNSESENAAMLERNVYVPANYISPEACALLAAAEASAARRADALDARGMELDVNGGGASPNCTFKLDRCHDHYDPERVLLTMAPPKRFHRISWKSMSQRLLNRSTHTASSSSNSGFASI